MEEISHFAIFVKMTSLYSVENQPNDLHNYTTHELLFGKENVPFHENKYLFLKVQDLIIKSGRFASQS